nr:hypothetical protein HmN_000335800 [Hymenolepis microstoma]
MKLIADFDQSLRIFIETATKRAALKAVCHCSSYAINRSEQMIAHSNSDTGDGFYGFDPNKIDTLMDFSGYDRIIKDSLPGGVQLDEKKEDEDGVKVSKLCPVIDSLSLAVTIKRYSHKTHFKPQRKLSSLIIQLLFSKLDH